MPLIKERIIDQIIGSAEVVDVAQQLGLDLKKSGSNFKCCSPWSDEKTPSCMFSPQKNIFKDFSTGRGGSPVKLIQEVKGIPWLEAIHFLADMYHVELEFEEEDVQEVQKRTTREEMLKVMEAATRQYVDQFRSLPDDHPAKVYMNGRLDEDQILEWQIGYAPDAWDFIKAKAVEKGIVEQTIECGLVARKGDGKTYDFFRDRIMFPICDRRGRVVSFGARTYPSVKKLTDKASGPKYLNGADSPIYSKSKVLYGLDRALGAINSQGRVFLLEGYTDVIRLHQHGLTNAVAACGTSLNELHARIIKRYTDHVVIVMDSDENQAGQKAAERSLNLLLKEGFKVDVIPLPEGKDPDSFLSPKSLKK